MNNLVNIISRIGTEKTLIIAFGEHGLSKHVQFDGRIFIYSLPDSALHSHDAFEKGQIQYYVESIGCKQVVIVGSMREDLIRRLAADESNQSPAAALKFNMKAFLRNQDKKIISGPRRDQMLLELHIIKQCTMLMDYYFIRERVESSRLQVRGLVIEQMEEILKPIFHNGLTYNNVISMN